MPNPYTSQSVGFGQFVDPEQQAIDRQRQMAMLLRQQAIQPDEVNQVVAGRVVPYSVTQGLAKLLQGYSSRKGLEDADARQADLYQKQAQNRAQGLEEFQRLYQGTPEKQVQSMAPTVGNTPQNPQMVTQPAVAGNPQAAYAALLRSNDPALAQMGMQGIAMLPQIEARKQEQAQARQDRLDLVKQQIEARKEAQQQAFENQKFLRSIAAANGGGQPYFQPVQTAQGVMAFNARTGRMEPIQIGGQGVVGSASDPALQGRIAGAKQTAEAEAKREFNLGGVGDIISRAETVLTGKGKDKPTSSMIGNVVDKAAAVVGQTPSGAAQADELRVLGGYLVSKMPRMEGPQSNYDVQNYKEMAGDVGNPNLPIERRMAALSTLKGIISKYDNKGGSQSAASTAGQQRVRRFNPATGMIE